MLDCREVLAALASDIDGEAASALKRELETHLAQCRTCRAIYDSTHKTLRLITESRSFELPQWIAERVAGRVRARRAGG